MNRGIYFLANDPVLEWMIAAYTSLRARGCVSPVTVIPFDDRLTRLARWAAREGLEIWNAPGLEELDRIGALFNPSNRPGAHMFRKFAAFWGPYDSFLYLDCDTVAGMNYDEILQGLEQSEAEFLYFDVSAEYVYKPGALRDRMVQERGSARFNAGAFASRRGLFSLARVQELAAQAASVAEHWAEQMGDQPFLNYSVDLSGIKHKPAAEVIPRLYSFTWISSPVRIDLDAPGARRFPFVHWAGYKLKPGIPHQEIFLQYRLARAPWRDRLRYAWSWGVLYALARLRARLAGLRRRARG